MSFQSNYGIDNPDCVAAVKAVLEELDMVGVYRTYEDKTYSELISLIETLSTDDRQHKVDFADPSVEKLPRQFFVDVVNLFHQRQK